MVVDAQAAAGVDRLDLDSIPFELTDQFGDRRQRRTKGLGVLDLGTDVNADTNRVQILRSLYLLVHRPGSLDVDPELVLPQSGRYIRMSVGENVRVDAQGDLGAHPPPASPLSQQRHLRFTLNVKDQNSGGEGEIDLRRCLAH